MPVWFLAQINMDEPVNVKHVFFTQFGNQSIFHNHQKSIGVTILSFCQNDSLMGEITLAKGQNGHADTF